MTSINTEDRIIWRGISGERYMDYLTNAVNTIKKNDARLATIIDQIGPCSLNRRTQGFPSLVHSIISQQLSKSSAQAIRSRFEALFGDKIVNPDRLMRISDEELRNTGLSKMKVEYLHNLANHVISGNINFLALEDMDDETVINTLIQVKGIGRWTAEMYLMFAMGRLDVFSFGDLAIRKAIHLIYNLNETDFEVKARQIAERWRPFRSIGCWYLYRYLDS